MTFEPLADDQVYRVVITAFLAEGGDGYSMIKENAEKIDIFGMYIMLILEIIECQIIVC